MRDVCLDFGVDSIGGIDLVRFVCHIFVHIPRLLGLYGLDSKLFEGHVKASYHRRFVFCGPI